MENPSAMSDGAKDDSRKHLSAMELLRNRGICSKAWEEWEESSRTLPKIGAKQFEPNGSWLQNKQIEKGLESRKFLLGIERVERASQLANAEWLPDQKKARVTKKSGQDWTNFGLEVNTNLYLIAEEALILLETECLELLWNCVPLSIEQAYEVLVDSEGSDCSLEEYRVYSQLTRLGYRLQRFCYEKSSLERLARPSESGQRKKVLVDPENGLWMAGKNTESSVEDSQVPRKSNIDNDIKEIVEDMMTTINGDGTKKVKTQSNASQKSVKPENTKNDKAPELKAKNSRVEIVCEETILSPIKIVKESDLPVSKWPGARIQRNVKLLPKRNDKFPTTIATTESQSINIAQSKDEISASSADKRKRSQSRTNSPETKKSKHEVIELSDDEIEEIPRPMSRMEMLNCLPNIASQIFITENISRRYIPRGVKPQRSYKYDGRRLRKMHEEDRTLRRNSDAARQESTNGSRSNLSESDSANSENAIVPYQQHCPPYNRLPRQNHPNNYYPQNARPYFTNRNQFPSNALMMNMPANFCMPQMSVRPEVWQNRPTTMLPANRWTSFQMNMFRNSALLGYTMRNIMQNFYNANRQQNIPWLGAFQHNNNNNRPHRYLERPWRGSNSSRSRGSPRCGTSSISPRQNAPSTSYSTENSAQLQSRDEVYQPAFTKLPGTSSWVELKQKWREAKTITIDDEDCTNFDENEDINNEIQVVDQTLKPLNGAKNARSIPEIYERLRIIKSAPERTVRRRKDDLKISYNVYSNTQHYRKVNPGLPMFHLVVTSREERSFLQPVELNRLQQDGKGAPIMFAHVSNSSIAYIQPGLVSLPNLI